MPRIAKGKRSKTALNKNRQHFYKGWQKVLKRINDANQHFCKNKEQKII